MLGHHQLTAKHSHFSSQSEESQKAEIELNESLTFDDLHRMTLIGLHVTQYMYVLFDKVHIYIKKISFYIGALRSVVLKHAVIVQRTTSIHRNNHKC